MKTHTKTRLLCPKCWKEIVCTCGEPLFLDHFATQFASKGGRRRAEKTTKIQRQQWGRKGGLTKAKHTKLIKDDPQ